MTRRHALRASLVLACASLVQCSSSPGGTTFGAGATCADLGDAGDYSDDAGACYPDGDGLNGGSYTFDLTVDDTGFSKNILATQNDAQVTVTLKNIGTKPHGFVVGCANVCQVYPNLPAGCSPTACFPSNATIAPLAPGASATITFDTPTPDGIIYPFKSSAPGDSTVPGLSDSQGTLQWTLM
jgi:hypothetical protein